MHALWALVGTGRLDAKFHRALLDSDNPALRAWGVRAAGNFGKVDEAIVEKIASLAGDDSPDVQLQVAIAARKVEGLDPLPLLVEVAASCGDDKLIPHIVWQNLYPLLPDSGTAFVVELKKHNLAESPALKQLLPRYTDWLTASKKKE